MFYPAALLREAAEALSAQAGARRRDRPPLRRAGRADDLLRARSADPSDHRTCSDRTRSPRPRRGDPAGGRTCPRGRSSTAAVLGPRHRLSADRHRRRRDRVRPAHQRRAQPGRPARPRGVPPAGAVARRAHVGRQHHRQHRDDVLPVPWRRGPELAAIDDRQSARRDQAGPSLSGSGWRSSIEASARLARLAIPDADAPVEPSGAPARCWWSTTSPTSRGCWPWCGRPATTSRSPSTAGEALDLVWQQEFDDHPARRPAARQRRHRRARGAAREGRARATQRADDLRRRGDLERGAPASSAGPRTSCPGRSAPAILRARLGAYLEKKFLRDQGPPPPGPAGRRGPPRQRPAARAAARPDRRRAAIDRHHRRAGSTTSPWCSPTSSASPPIATATTPKRCSSACRTFSPASSQLALEFGVQKIKTDRRLLHGRRRPVHHRRRAPRPALRAIRPRHPGRLRRPVAPRTCGSASTSARSSAEWSARGNTCSASGATPSTPPSASNRTPASVKCASARRRGARVEPDYTTESIGRSEIKGKGEAEIFVVVGGASRRHHGRRCSSPSSSSSRSAPRWSS